MVKEIINSRPASQVRQGQRDTITVLCAAVLTVCSYLFQLEPPPEVNSAMLTIMVILAHRWAPDIASRRRP